MLFIERYANFNMNFIANIIGKDVWDFCVIVVGCVLIGRFITNIISWWKEKDGLSMRIALTNSLGNRVTLQCGKSGIIDGSVAAIYSDGFKVIWENTEDPTTPVLFYVPFSEIGGIAVALRRGFLHNDDGTKQVFFDLEPSAQHYTVELHSLPQHWSVKKDEQK
jgi:hypothetical protein